MTKVITDAVLRARLHDLRELLEVCDESGRTLGYFHPVEAPPDQPCRRVQSPFTEQELERRRQESGGFTLQEILQKLANS